MTRRHPNRRLYQVRKVRPDGTTAATRYVVQLASAVRLARRWHRRGWTVHVGRTAEPVSFEAVDTSRWQLDRPPPADDPWERTPGW